MAQFEFAIQEDDGKLINISQLETKNRWSHRFLCPHCKEILTPILGPRREHHFRHKVESCNYNDYLHTLAETLFVQEYSECLKNQSSFYLSLDAPIPCNKACVMSKDVDCKERYIHHDIDLTKHFIYILPETTVSIDKRKNRRPDILLETKEGRQLWVEIFVSNETSQEKLEDAKKRDAQVIQIKITDEDCKGIRMIRQHKVEVSDDVMVFNMEPKASSSIISTQLPCMKFFEYERKRGVVSTRILNACVPDPFVDYEYRLVLKLNWEKDFSVSSDKTYNHYPKTILEDFCLQRERSQGGANKLDSIITYEKRGVPFLQAPPKTAHTTFNKPTVRRSQQIERDAPPIDIDLREKDIEYRPHYKVDPAQYWVDLGLPSGTIWSCCDDDPGLNDTATAFPEYTKCIPSVADIKELIQHCFQQNEGGTLCVIGPNSHAITFQKEKYQLLDKGRDYRMYFNIYSLVSPHHYIHLIDDDLGVPSLCRYVLHRTGNSNQ